MPEGHDLGQRLLAPPADLGALDRGTAFGPGLVQTIKGEQGIGKLVFEFGEAFSGGGYRGESGAKSVPVLTYC